MQSQRANTNTKLWCMLLVLVLYQVMMCVLADVNKKFLIHGNAIIGSGGYPCFLD